MTEPHPLDGYPVAWFADRIHKSVSWVYAHVDELPHQQVGGSLRFTEDNLAEYWRITKRGGVRMATTGRRRTA